MTSKIQLITFVISFIYGIFFSILTIFNFKLIKNLKRYIQHFITFIYVLDMIIIYIIVLYKINNGYCHIYFILMVIFGFIIGLFLYNYYFSKINVNKIMKKLKKD